MLRTPFFCTSYALNTLSTASIKSSLLIIQINKSSMSKSRFMNILSSLMVFLAKAPGRQKLCRLFQYFCTFLVAFYKESYSKNISQRNAINQILSKVESVGGCMGMTRKILRFGPSINCIRNFIVSVQSLRKGDYKEETNIHITKTLSFLFIGCYFIADHYLWLCKVGLINNSPIKDKFEFIATFSWLLDSIDGLAKNYCLLSNARFSPEKTKELSVDILRYCCDLPVAIYFLFPGRVNGKVAGLLGTLTSVLGIYQMWA